MMPLAGATGILPTPSIFGGTEPVNHRLWSILPNVPEDRRARPLNVGLCPPMRFLSLLRLYYSTISIFAQI